MFASTIADGTGVHSKAGPAISVQAKAWFALTVIGSQGIHTSVLAAPVVNLALINIFTHLPVSLQPQPIGALAVETPNRIAALGLATTIPGFTFIDIILTARSLETRRAATELRRSFHAVSSIETNSIIADRVKTASIPSKLGPSWAALVHSLVFHAVHLPVVCVIGCSAFIACAPQLPSTALFPHFDHPSESLDARLPVPHYHQLLLRTNVWHKRL